MMARSTTRSNQRPDTLMQDRSPPARQNPLATHGRTIHLGQTRKYSPGADVFRFTPGSGHPACGVGCPSCARNGLTHRSKQLHHSITLSARAHRAHSGNPAFRRPSISSFAFDCPPRAIHEDIVKAGSTSSRCAAASRASASHPRWAKADTRQR